MLMAVSDKFTQGYGGDETEVKRTGHRQVGFGFEFTSTLVQVNLLVPKAEATRSAPPSPKLSSCIPKIVV